MVNCEISIAAYCPGWIITLIPASCPAEVTVVIEMMTACHHSNPMEIAIIPNVKDTDRYPKHMGRPSTKPFKNVFFFKFICYRLLSVPVISFKGQSNVLSFEYRIFAKFKLIVVVFKCSKYIFSKVDYYRYVYYCHTAHCNVCNVPK